MPIYTLCLRPDEYKDIRLFVPRQEVEPFLEAPGGRQRLLVTGERGIGKSIGVDTFLQPTLREGKTGSSPSGWVPAEEAPLREYTDEEIRRFLEEDRLDAETRGIF